MRNLALSAAVLLSVPSAGRAMPRRDGHPLGPRQAMLVRLATAVAYRGYDVETAVEIAAGRAKELVNVRLEASHPASRFFDAPVDAATFEGGALLFYAASRIRHADALRRWKLADDRHAVHERLYRGMKALGAEPGRDHLERLEAARHAAAEAGIGASGAELDLRLAELLLLTRGWAAVRDDTVVPTIPEREVGFSRAPRSLAPLRPYYLDDGRGF